MTVGRGGSCKGVICRELGWVRFAPARDEMSAKKGTGAFSIEEAPVPVGRLAGRGTSGLVDVDFDVDEDCEVFVDVGDLHDDLARALDHGAVGAVDVVDPVA